jgi:ribonuclease III
MNQNTRTVAEKLSRWRLGRRRGLFSVEKQSGTTRSLSYHHTQPGGCRCAGHGFFSADSRRLSLSRLRAGGAAVKRSAALTTRPVDVNVVLDSAHPNYEEIMPQELTTNYEAEILEECQNAIGYHFRQPDLLRSALTHASGANTRLASNERLEFLGDAVLGLVCCEQLYLRFPDYQEGDLTKIKSVVVSRRTCARMSRQLNLGDFLFLGKGMHPQMVVPSNMQADVFESLVAGIYLDGGLEEARRFILRHLGPEIEQVAEGAHGGNFKSVLQQVAQREFGSTPQYVMLDEKGPDHSKCFKIAAQIDRYTYAGAWGRNKKEAEQKAAMNALARIHGDPVPYPTD